MASPSSHWHESPFGFDETTPTRKVELKPLIPMSTSSSGANASSASNTQSTAAQLALLGTSPTARLTALDSRNSANNDNSGVSAIQPGSALSLHVDVNAPRPSAPLGMSVIKV